MPPGTESRGHHEALPGGSGHVIVPSRHSPARLVTALALPRTFWGWGASAGHKEPARLLPVLREPTPQAQSPAVATRPHLPGTGPPRPGPRAAEGPATRPGQGSLLLQAAPGPRRPPPTAGRCEVPGAEATRACRVIPEGMARTVPQARRLLHCPLGRQLQQGAFLGPETRARPRHSGHHRDL